MSEVSGRVKFYFNVSCQLGGHKKMLPQIPDPRQTLSRRQAVCRAFTFSGIFCKMILDVFLSAIKHIGIAV